LSGTFKSDKHTTGIGLGLAVARGVARAHGGALEAQSEEGRGSVFRLSLARLHVGDLAARDAREASESPESSDGNDAPGAQPGTSEGEGQGHVEVSDAQHGRGDRGAA